MERVTYDDLEPLVTALRAGHTVAIPTDTVYGVACAAHLRVACEWLLRAKGRSLAQPSAIVAGSVDSAIDVVLPELNGAAADRTRRLLPGPADADPAQPGPPLPVAVRGRADPHRAARAGAAPVARRRHRARARRCC